MKKFLLLFVALLCTSLISCNKEEISITNNADIAVGSSNADNLEMTYITRTGDESENQCSSVRLDYSSNTTAHLQVYYADHSSMSTFGSDYQFTASIGHQLSVSIEGANPILLDDLYVDICNNQLCYNDANNVVRGTALGFIIEDELNGF